jgi:hypothetical protein
MPHVPRPFAVPGGSAGALACSALPTCWIVLAIGAVLWPGLGTGGGLPQGFEDRRLAYELIQLVALAVIAAAGVGFALAGRRSRGSSPAPYYQPLARPTR